MKKMPESEKNISKTQSVEDSYLKDSGILRA